MNKVNLNQIAVAQKEERIKVSCLYRSGTKDPILFLHGLGSTKYDFLDAFRSTVLKDHTLLAFDFPGCGSSGYTQSHSIQVSDLVNISSKIFNYFDLNSINIIGHSMGGLTGLLLCKRFPSRVKSFINIEGNITPEDCGIFSRSTAEHTWHEFVEKNFMASLRDRFINSNNIGANIFADRFLYSVLPVAFYNYCVSIVELSDSGTLMSEFLGLDLPRMFIFGGENNHLSYLSNLKESDIRVKEIDESNHWPHLDDPIGFAEAIKKFIEKS